MEKVFLHKNGDKLILIKLGDNDTFECVEDISSEYQLPLGTVFDSEPPSLLSFDTVNNDELEELPYTVTLGSIDGSYVYCDCVKLWEFLEDRQKQMKNKGLTELEIFVKMTKCYSLYTNVLENYIKESNS